MSYNLKNIVTSLDEIPESWIYKHFYAKLIGRDNKNKDPDIRQPFDGRIIKVRSAMNTDSTPSLAFYCKNKRYYWKDFSTGAHGDPVEFVKHHYNKLYGVAKEIIIDEYVKFQDNGGEFEEEEISDYDKPLFKFIYQRYDERHLEQWGKFKIPLQTLNKFKVCSSPNYQIIRNGNISQYVGLVYVYLCSKGPYQVYQPYYKPKYLNTGIDYLPGFEQLEYKSDTLVIVSGLKDIMAIDQVGLDAEYIAPSRGEASIINWDMIKHFRSKYKHIIAMLDNDSAGKLAMKAYRSAYGIPSVLIALEKDLADNNAKHELDYLKDLYAYYINLATNKI